MPLFRVHLHTNLNNKYILFVRNLSFSLTLGRRGKGTARPFSRNPECNLTEKKKYGQKKSPITMSESLMSSLRAVTEC